MTPPPRPSSDGRLATAPRADADLVAGRAAARLGRVVESAVADADLSLPQYRMLIFLSELGSAAASALAGKLEVSRPSVTALVDGLVARGLVERTADPDDRRRVSHAMTPEGIAALATADDAVARRLAELAEIIPGRDDRERAYEGLQHWLTAMNTQREAKLADQ